MGTLAFGNPWGLLALTSVPLLIAVHFFRRRRRPRRVAGLFLWPAGDALPVAGRRISRLETPLSLLMEILAALLLTALVADAKWERRTTVAHVIAVLDNSASMGARTTSGERFADRAVKEIARVCRECGPLESVRLTVILSGPRPMVAVGPAAEAARGLDELKSWTPMLPSHSFDPALQLAHRLVDEGAMILLVTDNPEHAVPQTDRGVRIVGVGEPLSNMAIVLADRTIDRADGGTQVLVRVANFSKNPAKRNVVLRAEDGGKRAEQELNLLPGGESMLTWALKADEGAVSVNLEGGQDALALDDHAFLARPSPRNVRIRCEFPASNPVGARIERACRAVPEAVWLGPGDTDAPQVVIAPTETAPPATGETWLLAMGSAPGDLRAGSVLDPLVGPYFADSSHPLMRELDFRGVIWSGAAPVKPGTAPAPLLAAADVPLIFAWDRGGGTAFLVNIDPERTNIHKSPAWPMLFFNLVAVRREALPGLRRWNFRQGETISWRPGPGEETANKVIDPRGREISPIRMGRSLEIPQTVEPGLYTIRREGKPIDRFAVLFLDPAESDLRGAGDVVPPAPKATASALQVTTRLPWLDPGLCLAILAFVLLDLAWLRKRTA